MSLNLNGLQCFEIVFFSHHCELLFCGNYVVAYHIETFSLLILRAEEGVKVLNFVFSCNLVGIPVNVPRA